MPGKTTCLSIRCASHVKWHRLSMMWRKTWPMSSRNQILPQLLSVWVAGVTWRSLSSMEKTVSQCKFFSPADAWLQACRRRFWPVFRGPVLRMECQCLACIWMALAGAQMQKPCKTLRPLRDGTGSHNFTSCPQPYVSVLFHCTFEGLELRAPLNMVWSTVTPVRFHQPLLNFQSSERNYFYLWNSQVTLSALPTQHGSLPNCHCNIPALFHADGALTLKSGLVVSGNEQARFNEILSSVTVCLVPREHRRWEGRSPARVRLSNLQNISKSGNTAQHGPQHQLYHLGQPSFRKIAWFLDLERRSSFVRVRRLRR